MTAGIYLARRGKNAVILESGTYGGQIINSGRVENYPGIKSISGFDFATQVYEQLLEHGGKVEYGKVTDINIHGNRKTVVTTDREYNCKQIIIASGARNRPMDIDGEEALIGHGISYCANCDGAFYKNKVTAVYGGGNTALDDAEFLSGLCSRVYLIHRRSEFRGDVAAVKRLKQMDNVQFVLDSTVEGLIKNDSGMLSGIVIKNKITGECSELAVNGLFVAIGQIPNTEFLKGKVELDKYGYVIAGEDCKTAVDGVYAAGDCRTKLLRQLATAAADGAVAAQGC